MDPGVGGIPGPGGMDPGVGGIPGGLDIGGRPP
jgi:hypothetical protein